LQFFFKPAQEGDGIPRLPQVSHRRSQRAKSLLLGVQEVLPAASGHEGGELAGGGCFDQLWGQPKAEAW